jgi:hypothetical protein
MNKDVSEFVGYGGGDEEVGMDDDAERTIVSSSVVVIGVLLLVGCVDVGRALRGQMRTWWRA